MRVLSIKVHIRKKSGNLFNGPRIYIYIYIEAEYIYLFIYLQKRNNFEKMFLIWLVQFLKKKHDKSIRPIIQELSFIKIQPNMSELEKKRQRIVGLLNSEIKPKFLGLLRIILILLSILIIINDKIRKCSELAQKEYKATHDWVGKVIHGELCKKVRFDNTNKCYMHNSESVLENETHKLLWDFETQTDPLISARRSDLEIINKKRELTELWT